MVFERFKLSSIINNDNRRGVEIVKNGCFVTGSARHFVYKTCGKIGSLQGFSRQLAVDIENAQRGERIAKKFKT